MRSIAIANYAQITLDTSRLVEFVGDTDYFSAVSTYKGAELPVPFSANPEVARVDFVKSPRQGGYIFQVTALKTGTTEIGLSIAGSSATFPISVVDDISLDVSPELQLPELPAGCEVTALSALLKYYGFPTDKFLLADKFLPMNDTYYVKDGKDYRADPNKYFVGSPHSDKYGCYAPVITRTANAYLQSVRSPLRAKNITGEPPSALYSRLAGGAPVVAWVTIDLKPPTHYRTWYDVETETPIQWMGGNHCVVLIGCNTRTVTLMDPLYGIVTYERTAFESRYNQHGRQAVVLEKENA